MRRADKLRSPNGYFGRLWNWAVYPQPNTRLNNDVKSSEEGPGLKSNLQRSKALSSLPLSIVLTMARKMHNTSYEGVHNGRQYPPEDAMQWIMPPTLNASCSSIQLLVPVSMESCAGNTVRVDYTQKSRQWRLVMVKHIVLSAALAVGLVAPALGSSDRNDDIERIQHATEVFHDIMATPDKAIPQELLESAKCIAIIPGEKKAAFVVGGNYGKGLATCRTAGGWSAPLFLAVGGGSVGFQIGGSSTDVVMIFMNDKGMHSLLSDKFKIGADATAAAGPVGRHAAADTDAKMNAEILTYSRSTGLFAGISLDGAVVQADESGDHAMYGRNVNRREIIDGNVRVPEAAEPLLREIAQYTHAQQASSKRHD